MLRHVYELINSVDSIFVVDCLFTAHPPTIQLCQNHTTHLSKIKIQ